MSESSFRYSKKSTAADINNNSSNYSSYSKRGDGGRGGHSSKKNRAKMYSGSSTNNINNTLSSNTNAGGGGGGGSGNAGVGVAGNNSNSNNRVNSSSSSSSSYTVSSLGQSRSFNYKSYNGFNANMSNNSNNGINKKQYNNGNYLANRTNSFNQGSSSSVNYQKFNKTSSTRFNRNSNTSMSNVENNNPGFKKDEFKHKQSNENMNNTGYFKKPIMSTNPSYMNNSNQGPMMNNFNYNRNKQYQMITPPFQPVPYNNNRNSNINNNNNNNSTNSSSMNTGSHNRQHHGSHNNHSHSKSMMPTHSSSNSNLKPSNTEKYNHKYNLISFILLRRNDDFSADLMLNDQIFYEKVDSFIERADSDGLNKFFVDNNKMPAFLNVYNSSLFVYTIRKCFESSSSTEFTRQVIEMMFKKDIRPAGFYFFIDGDYPKRNLVHYAARYNSTVLLQAILDSVKEETQEKETVAEKENSTTELVSKEAKKPEDLLLQLSIQLDFNMNTPVHLACQYNSCDALKVLLTSYSPLLIEQTVFLFNSDGLNPFLLAARHSDLKLIRMLVDFYQASTANCFDLGLILLASLDLGNFKNCIHNALSQDSRTSHSIVRHLIQVAHSVDKMISATNQNYNNHVLTGLVGAVSKLVGSVYHVAASNLTRMETFWYLLNLDQKITSSFKLDATLMDRIDFREFSVVDCFIDSLMNLREMAPSDCKCLQSFYDSILHNDQEEANLTDANSEDEEDEVSARRHKRNFDQLYKKCLYKLLVEIRSSVFQLPRIRNKLQLIEYLKLLIFLSKLDTRLNYKLINSASNHHHSEHSPFEVLCIHFIGKFFIENSEGLFCFQSNSQSQASSNTPTSCNTKCSSHWQKVSQDVSVYSQILTLLDEFYQVVSVAVDWKFTRSFRNKMLSFLIHFSTSLSRYVGELMHEMQESPERVSREEIESSRDELLKTKSKIDEIVNRLRTPYGVLSLKNLCRARINLSIRKNKNSTRSALDKNFVYFNLPSSYLKYVNFLTFNLIDDLYGVGFDLEKFALFEKL